MKTKTKSWICSLFILGVLLMFSSSCKKDNNKNNNENNTNPIETGTVNDIDGNVYKTVKIGTQWWMAENLKVTRYRNGDSIPEVTNPADWCSLTKGASCYYDDDNNKLSIYGRLYNWYVVSDTRNLAPVGWHISTLSDWEQLFNYLGGPDSDGGTKLKDKYSWVNPYYVGTNSTGFTALAAGFRHHKSGLYSSMGYYTDWWSPTADNDSVAVCWGVSWTSYWLMEEGNYKKTGYSVRFVKDSV